VGIPCISGATSCYLGFIYPEFTNENRGNIFFVDKPEKLVPNTGHLNGKTWIREPVCIINSRTVFMRRINQICRRYPSNRIIPNAMKVSSPPVPIH
jgi:hypothetical protein